MYRVFFSFALVAGSLLSCNSVEAAHPFYVHAHHTYRPVATRVVSRQTLPSRQVIQEMPLLMRPNRVGHFYGNTVRRMHYTGRLLPRLR